jgi:hypothetical protein
MRFYGRKSCSERGVSTGERESALIETLIHFEVKPSRCKRAATNTDELLVPSGAQRLQFGRGCRGRKFFRLYGNEEMRDRKEGLGQRHEPLAQSSRAVVHYDRNPEFHTALSIRERRQDMPRLTRGNESIPVAIPAHQSHFTSIVPPSNYA